ncbi:UNVERIFIED_ORG: hypothetical protein OKW14_002094 [Pantoea brenneri]|jgi:hypothetical protein|nr:hypothetical protein [Pantoea brenneri]
MKKIRTNRKNLNKTVRKKERVNFIILTFDQYENILCSNISIARICNVLKVNCDKNFFRKLKANELTEYEDWYKKVKGN